MPYRYVAYTANRSIVEGTVASATESAAEDALLRAGYQPIVIRRISEGLTLARLFPTLFGVKLHEVTAMAQQLAMLLRSGIPLVTALESLRTHFKNKTFRTVLGAVTQGVRGGLPLSEALKEHPLVFPTLYVRMVAAGERGGDLEGMLQEVANYYKREIGLRKRIRSAMFYPIIVILMTFVVGIVMVTWVLPQVIYLAKALGVKLPLITRAFLGGASFVVAYKWHLLTGLGAMVAGFIVAVRNPEGRALLHRVVLRVPLIGKIVVDRELARLSRTMSLLIERGLPLPDILAQSAALCGNMVLAAALREARQEVVSGKPMTGPLIRCPYFPTLFLQMLRTGEQSGSLATTLATVADSYEAELEDTLHVAISLLEPMLTIAVGAMVALMALSVVWPIYHIVGNAG